MMVESCVVEGVLMVLESLLSLRAELADWKTEWDAQISNLKAEAEEVKD